MTKIDKFSITDSTAIQCSAHKIALKIDCDKLDAAVGSRALAVLAWIVRRKAILNLDVMVTSLVLFEGDDNCIPFSRISIRFFEGKDRGDKTSLLKTITMNGQATE